MLNEPDVKALYSSEFYSTAFQKPKHIDDLIATALSLSDAGNALDIGCNDGAFMHKLNEHGFYTVGIEPNKEPAKIAKKHGLTVEGGFFDSKMVEKIKSQYGKFDTIFARHVLEHVIDPNKFIEGTFEILKPDGLLCIELPDVDVGLTTGNPVVIWEEHLNYFTRNYLKKFFDVHGLKLVAYREYIFGGGAITYFLKRKDGEASATTASIMPTTSENNIFDFNKKAKSALCAFTNLKNLAQRHDIDIVVYGAGPRTSTLLNFFDSSGDVEAIFDDRDEIQGLYLPNMRVPVSDATSYKFSSPTTIILLGVGAEVEGKIKQTR